MNTGHKLIALIDTGATNNYISLQAATNTSQIPLSKPVVVKTIHGISQITSYIMINIFSQDLKFFVIQDAGNFDLIFGMDGLRKINAILDLSAFTMSYTINTQIIHYIINDNTTDMERLKIDQLIQENNGQELLPYNTKVCASIRTITNIPVWTKQFPYPISAKDFVNREINKLLKNGIIRPSYSPYNSPIWVVPKDGFNEDGTPKKRLVIDYGKLNAQTTFDRYPMPDINIILSNLGEAEFFSKIDLESGFHQIKIRDEDIEKTAFSVNGAKYEFTRMPFGLKNAPSIFQRTIDDMLRPFIGKFAYVYMDDVIIFSKTRDEHLQHITEIISTFTKGHMRISTEKSFFFYKEIEYLGQVISHGRITVSPTKVEAIKIFEPPQTLRQLRSFLGMAGTYRKYIKNYASITKPLSILLRSEHGRITAKTSPKISITLDDNAKKAFNEIKEKIQENIELYQPDFTQKFELTTDASNHAIGAVLSQQNHPITFISRTLTKTEEKYATNEKELLAIVWALKTLRHYLYGIASFTIFTDHQPLTSAITEKNSNLKLKRWKAFIEESGAEIKYKPGKENLVADALSRQYDHIINHISEEGSIHSISSSPPKDHILRTTNPINTFKNQIHIKEATSDSIRTSTIFPGYVQHTIKYTSVEELCQNMDLVINPHVYNGIFTSEETFFHIKKEIQNKFPHIKIMFTTVKARNITDENEATFLIINEHERAHRHYYENFRQLRQNYFFPKMKNKIKAHIRNCEICKKQKYDTRPQKYIMKATPIPTYVGEYLQIDIFHVGKRIFYSTIDRFSKFVYLREAPNKLNADKVILEILQIFPKCKHCMTDNEAIFTSFVVKTLFQRKKIIHTLAPVQHSTTNSQVERFHRTILEMGRCLAEQQSEELEDIILDVVIEYNNTIHSVIKAKPIDVFHQQDKFQNIISMIEKAQTKMLAHENKKRRNKEYNETDIIYAKNNRRNKKSAPYRKHTVKRDEKEVIITDKNIKIHKDNIRT